MKVYISGPMTGLPDFNGPAFEAAEQTLRAIGLDPVNPAKNGLPKSAQWHMHMRADIKMMMDCDGVAVLPGAEMSRGARHELLLAEALKMEIRPLQGWYLWNA